MTIITFILIAFILAALIIALAFLVPGRQPYAEKISSYECGFEPFSDARSSFDVHFYLVGIMFLVFDIEIAFLYPYAVSASRLGNFGFWVVNVFFAILVLGFVYE